MKIQYHRDQIRIRLTTQEVEALNAGRPLEHETRFGSAQGERHAFRLERDTTPTEGIPIRLDYEAGTAVIRMEAGLLAGLAGEHTVGQEVEQSVEGAGSLRILVERDLKPRRG
jgi:hypothetical protein